VALVANLESPRIIRRNAMKLIAVCVAVLLVSSWAWAGSKTYQATGPVVDVRDDVIVIDKGKEGKWEIARDANTKVNGTLQKGAKVTVHYRMQATEIETKEADKQPKP
jgi:hypothetical protein